MSDTLNKNQILYGLGAIKGTGDSSIDLIIDERKNNGPYESLFDQSLPQRRPDNALLK